MAFSTDSSLDLPDDLGLPIDSVPALLDDNPSFTIPDSDLRVDISTSARYRCINCGLDISRMRRHTLEVAGVMSVIQQWIHPRQVSNDSLICHSCWTVATNAEVVSDGPRGHQHVCVNCGRSLLRIRYHELRTNTDRERRIKNVIKEWILPNTLRQSDHICHPCWQRADRAAVHFSEPSTSSQGEPPQDPSEGQQEPSEVQAEEPPAPLPQSEGVIYLPNYSRASDTQRRCIFPYCIGTERRSIPTALRVRLFCDHNYYVPPNCRICNDHLLSNAWHLLVDELSRPIKTFNANQIEDFATLLKENSTTNLDFENIQQMPDHLVHYWLGFSKAKFGEILSEVPRLANKKRGSFALAAYLLKLRTGDSDQRIASLLQTPRSTLERLMSMARELLHQDFVPVHLGLNHITRADIASRNLFIPKHLFGGEENSPIVIADGTYRLPARILY